MKGDHRHPVCHRRSWQGHKGVNLAQAVKLKLQTNRESAGEGCCRNEGRHFQKVFRTLTELQKSAPTSEFCKPQVCPSHRCNADQPLGTHICRGGAEQGERKLQHKTGVRSKDAPRESPTAASSMVRPKADPTSGDTALPICWYRVFRVSVRTCRRNRGRKQFSEGIFVFFFCFECLLIVTFFPPSSKGSPFQ